MRVTRILILLSATLWGVPGMAAPPISPLLLCTCKLQSLPALSYSEVEEFSKTLLSLGFYPQTLSPAQTLAPESPKQVADGTPADDKGTPGNRGKCQPSRCTSYQFPSPQDSGSRPK